MPTRRRADFLFPPGSGGGPGGGGGNVSWGPDFGEAGGADGKTFGVGVSVDLDALALSATKNVGVHLTMPALQAVYTEKAVGVHASAEALGAPLWQAEAHAALAASAAEITCNVPAGVQNGELLVAFVGALASAASPDIDTPAGWNLIRHDTIGNQHARSFWRIASSEPASYTFTFTATANQATAEIHRILGANAGTPVNVHAGATASAADPVSPTVTTTAINCLVFAFLSHAHGALSQTHTPPASNDERTDFQSTVSLTILGSTTDTRIFNAAAATGTATHNCTETLATNAIMQRVAIAPGTFTLQA